MTVSSINGIAFTSLSAIDGRTLSTLSAVNSQTIVASVPDPSTIANIWEWWEPSREGLANNDPIAQLTGQFSPGTAFHNFLQGTAPRKPIFISNQINGLGIARFSAAAANVMTEPNPSALTAAHFWIVVQVPADPPATPQIPWVFGTDILTDVYPFTDGVIYSTICSTARKVVGDPTPSLAAWRVFEVVSISGTWTALLDGTQIFTTGTNTVGVNANCAIGANGSGATTPWNGDIAGIYLFSAQLTGSDRTAMVTYLNSRFALSVS